MTFFILHFKICENLLKFMKNSLKFKNFKMQNEKCHYYVSYTPESMRCDYWASLLARSLASLYIGRKPKVRVATHLASIFTPLGVL
jgi:hypothetical protein